jgi:hypothetical protein
MAIYSHMDHKGRAVTFRNLDPQAGGVRVWANPDGVLIPDDEIPGLVAALQNYMSKRAKEITKAAANAR